MKIKLTPTFTPDTIRTNTLSERAHSNKLFFSLGLIFVNILVIKNVQKSGTRASTLGTSTKSSN